MASTIVFREKKINKGDSPFEADAKSLYNEWSYKRKDKRNAKIAGGAAIGGFAGMLVGASSPKYRKAATILGTTAGSALGGGLAFKSDEKAMKRFDDLLEKNYEGSINKYRKASAKEKKRMDREALEHELAHSGRLGVYAKHIADKSRENIGKSMWELSKLSD